jgi:hypothetical protein
MSAPKRVRDDGPAAGGAGGPPPPARRTRAAIAAARAADLAYERRLKLTDIIGFVALNGYAREADACAGLCRETWRCIPAGLSAADADRVRHYHPLWQAIIDLKHGVNKKTRLIQAAYKGDLARVRELCDWRADVEARDRHGQTALHCACSAVSGSADCARELINRKADTNAASEVGFTPLMVACIYRQVDPARLLLAAGADKRRVDSFGRTARSFAVNNGNTDLVALLDAAL